LRAPIDLGELSWPARAVRDSLVARGASFAADLARSAKLLPADVDRGVGELIAAGVLTSDSFASVRQLLRPAHRRREPSLAAGRWSLLAADQLPAPSIATIARVLLRRYGVIFRAVVARERQPIAWRDLARELRLLELRGEIRGGRFVAGFAGEQFALPDAIPALRKARDAQSTEPAVLARNDPLQVALQSLFALSLPSPTRAPAEVTVRG
jgi:ATP-dependent Lhr-like helicase